MLQGAIEEAWDDFVRHLTRKGRSKDTAAVYRKSLDSFWRWAADQGLPPDPGAVTRDHINVWTDHLLTQPASRNGKVQFDVDPVTGAKTPRPVQANTVRIRWQNLRPFFSWWAEEMDEPNPFDKADTPTLVEHAVPVVAFDDLRKILAACDGKEFLERRDTALVRFMLDTGARVGEVVAMTTDSWNRRTDLVTLTGKTGTRTVPISPSTGEAMARYNRVRTRHPLAAAAAFWLGARGGGALQASGIAQMLNRRCDEAGVARFHPHMLRHTWAHEMKSAGAAEGDLMQLGGWSTTVMVHRYGKSAAIARAQEAGRKIKLGDQL